MMRKSDIDTKVIKTCLIPDIHTLLFLFLAFIIPAGMLIATGHIPCGKEYLGVVFLTVAVGFTGFNRSGYNVNPQDIAPKYVKTTGDMLSLVSAHAAS